jgi:hypothetical protein
MRQDEKSEFDWLERREGLRGQEKSEFLLVVPALE